MASDYISSAFKDKIEELEKNNLDATKSDITEVITKTIDDIPSKVVSNGSKMIFDILADNIVQGNRIEIRGFGSFSTRYRPPRTAHNPRNGETLTTLGKYTPHFKAGNSLKNRVNKLTEISSYTKGLTEEEMA